MYRCALLLSFIFLLFGCSPKPQIAELATPAWSVQYEDPDALFIALSVVDENVVWVSGAPGKVGRSLDGGDTWTMFDGPWPDSLQFRDIEAFSEDEAFVLSIGNGLDSRIYHTTNSGASWRLSFQNEDENAFFDCFSFWDRQRGFAFSDSYNGEFTLIKTSDGGGLWQRISPDHVPDARDGEGSFAASGTCVETQPGGYGWFGTGGSGVDTRVIRTDDYGETWTEAITPIESTAGDEGIVSVLFWDAETGIALGGVGTRPMNNVAVTTDGGRSWQLTESMALGGRVYGASIVPDAYTPTIVAVSPGGSTISSDFGATWTQFDDFEYWTTEFLNPRTGWAAGRGRISRLVRIP